MSDFAYYGCSALLDDIASIHLAGSSAPRQPIYNSSPAYLARDIQNAKMSPSKETAKVKNNFRTGPPRQTGGIRSREKPQKRTGDIDQLADSVAQMSIGNTKPSTNNRPPRSRKLPTNNKPPTNNELPTNSTRPASGKPPANNFKPMARSKPPASAQPLAKSQLPAKPKPRVVPQNAATAGPVSGSSTTGNTAPVPLRRSQRLAQSAAQTSPGANSTPVANQGRKKKRSGRKKNPTAQVVAQNQV